MYSLSYTITIAMLPKYCIPNSKITPISFKIFPKVLLFKLNYIVLYIYLIQYFCPLHLLYHAFNLCQSPQIQNRHNIYSETHILVSHSRTPHTLHPPSNAAPFSCEKTRKSFQNFLQKIFFSFLFFSLLHGLARTTAVRLAKLEPGQLMTAFDQRNNIKI